MRFDYVIVGGGSAGCVLAARLSEDRDIRVLLLEAGGADRSPFIRAPGGVLHAIADRHLNWSLPVEPDPTIGLRGAVWPAGRVLGGGSAINGMVFVRGAPADYDLWAQSGCPGWSYREVAPLLKAMETYSGARSPERGREGLLRVGETPDLLPVSRLFAEAAATAGIKPTIDYNAGDRLGVGIAQATIHRGRRVSTASAYLKPAIRRTNLRVMTGALATRLVMEGSRCIGVDYLRSGSRCHVRAEREIIVAAGALATPKLLMLSGIGPPDHLREVGIAPLHARDGVGANLQEHPGLATRFGVTLRTYNREASRLGQLRNGLRWLLTRDGPASSCLNQIEIFLGEPLAPTTQLMMAPFGLERRAGRIAMARTDSITVSVACLHPEGRGRVRLRSDDPLAPPVIDHWLLAGDRDVATIRAGLRAVRAIFAAAPLAAHVRAEQVPGTALQGDGEIDQFIRANAGPGYHPVGTAKMGLDPDCVVDPGLKVHGLEGLRVADASIMPTITSGNTNGPTILIAEKAAALIRASR